MQGPHDAAAGLTAAGLLATAATAARWVLDKLTRRRPPPAGGNPAAPRADASRPRPA